MSTKYNSVVDIDIHIMGLHELATGPDTDYQ